MAERPTILMLGAGIDQNYPIRIAREEGLRVLAADINPDAPGFSLADEVAIVSNRDVASLKLLCDESSRKGHPIAGVLVMGADIPHIAAELSEYLGVPGPSLDTGKLTTDKFLMKERLSSSGVAIPWFSKVDSPAHMRKLMREHGGHKFVIKPTDRSGARGVMLIDANISDIDSLYYQAQAESYAGEVQLEEYIEGDQISTESILWEGKAYTPGFVDRNYEMLSRFYPHFIENGGVHPSTIQGQQRIDVYDLVEKAALSLGIMNGVAKGDVVISRDGKPMIIEMAARLSGGDFSESLIPLGCGVNIVRSAIRMAVGRVPDLLSLKDQWNRSVANRYFFGEPGILKAIHGLEEARELPWVRKLDVYVKPGDLIGQIKFHAERLGVFIVEADSPEHLSERIRCIYDLVRFESVS